MPPDREEDAVREKMLEGRSVHIPMGVINLNSHSDLQSLTGTDQLECDHSQCHAAALQEGTPCLALP